MQSISSELAADGHPLWQRIKAHAFPQAAPGCGFSDRLAREQGWTRAQAAAAIEEYRRFCFLAVTEAEVMCPSHQVDMVWHLHMTYTRDYWTRWCGEVLQTPLHHEPSRGGREQLAHHRELYAQTLARYEVGFGAPPPAWWPGTLQRFDRPGRYRAVDTARFWLLPKPRWNAPQLALSIVGLGLASIAWAMEGSPLEWRGADFLKLYALLMPASIILALIWRRLLRDNGAASPGGEIAPVELAYLVGGPTRGFDATVASLLQKEAIGWDEAGQRFVLLGSGGGLSASESALRNIVAGDGRPDQVLKLGSRLFSETRQKLVRNGQLLDDATARRAAFLPALLPVLVLLFGAAKILVGLQRDRPVAFLVVLSLIMLVSSVVLMLKRPQRSRAGDRIVAAQRRRHARLVRAPMKSEVPLAVALVGTAALSGTAWAGYHQLRAPAASSSNSSERSADASSDSGGSDSGGGCGGCGGGGD